MVDISCWFLFVFAVRESCDQEQEFSTGLLGTSSERFPSCVWWTCMVSVFIANLLQFLKFFFLSVMREYMIYCVDFDLLLERELFLLVRLFVFYWRFKNSWSILCLNLLSMNGFFFSGFLISHRVGSFCDDLSSCLKSFHYWRWKFRWLMEYDLKYKSLTIYSETISAGSLCPSAL